MAVTRLTVNTAIREVWILRIALYFMLIFICQTNKHLLYCYVAVEIFPKLTCYCGVINIGGPT